MQRMYAIWWVGVGPKKGPFLGGSGRGPGGAPGAGGGPVRPQGGDFNNLVNWWTARGNLP